MSGGSVTNFRFPVAISQYWNSFLFQAPYVYLSALVKDHCCWGCLREGIRAERLRPRFFFVSRRLATRKHENFEKSQKKKLRSSLSTVRNWTRQSERSAELKSRLQQLGERNSIIIELRRSSSISRSGSTVRSCGSDPKGCGFEPRPARSFFFFFLFFVSFALWLWIERLRTLVLHSDRYQPCVSLSPLRYRREMETYMKVHERPTWCAHRKNGVRYRIDLWVSRGNSVCMSK